ncbi:aldehyde dehydrogenase family protein [Legionella sp. CNM-4043-24]|uniref:aldehyde dehydrogenase family protein n=1 Tax=Legionella sp. CNM-4043-24 TaxID=3421646 RepID=UPI00403B24AF
MTGADDIQTQIADLRAYFNTGASKARQWRQQQLAGLARFLTECETEIQDALRMDLGKSPIESFVTEINMVASELRLAQKNLDNWLRAKRVSTPWILRPCTARILPEPLGLVLIIAPWNYPIQLILSPLVGALAAGNCVVLKPGEMAEASCRLLCTRLPQYLDPAAIRVIDGGVPETTALLAERFDHIFYTGNGRVGRLIMSAAARHLTPVTLELGGKSPCLVDRHCNIRTAAQRIVWGKFLNAGQTCVAPDYVLVHKDVEDELLHEMKRAIHAFWGNDPKSSPDYGRIINAAHFQRLMALVVGSGEVFTGGQSDAGSRYIAPTLLHHVGLDAPVMTEEIFGPLLPVLPVASIEEAIAIVNAKAKALALYLFTDSREHKKQVIEQTSSGSVCLNHVILQITAPELPFGGVGASGMGAYHGRYSFQTFSHFKPVLDKATWFDPAMAYPPYQRWLRYLTRWLG